MVQQLSRGDIQGALQTLNTALENLDKEGLAPLAAEVFEGLATIHWVIGEKEKATQFARTAVGFRADFGTALEPRNRTEDLEYMLKKMSE